jgi:hypothetical protein
LKLTDEEFIRIFITNKCSPAEVAKVAGVSKQAAEQKAHRLRGCGVRLPRTQNRQGRSTQYTPERVAALNKIVDKYVS